MSHTPGPWSAFGGRLVRHVVGDRAIPIAESRIPFGSTSNDEEAMEVEAANLRLISAAPELLEALEDLTSRIRVDDHAGCTHLLLGSKEYKAALTAIAKAEGES